MYQLNAIDKEQVKELVRQNLSSLSNVMIDPVILSALTEDLGQGGDITSNSVIPETTQAVCMMVARDAGCLSGLYVAERVFKLVDDSLNVVLLQNDGDYVVTGTEILQVSGNARSILIAERVALNFLGHMSGIASKTYDMVKKIKGTKARICSTRKTTPNLRMFEKYAVRSGGGVQHRLGLDDAVLIKDNHIAIAGDIKTALERACSYVGHTVKIEIEVDTLEQLEQVLDVGADIIMLDNMNLKQLERAVSMIGEQAIVEASGGVNIDTIEAIAKTGVDMISVGGLTHSVMCLDIGLDFRAVDNA